MVGRGSRALIGVAVVPALMCAALTVPSVAEPHRVAGRVRPLTLDPGVPVLGELVRLSGRAPGPAHRAVRLQVRRADGSWRSIDRRSTRRDRTFLFRLGAATAVPRTVRVLAPATEDAARVRFTPLTYVGTTRTVRLVVPTEARSGEPVVTTALVEPPRPGQRVELVLDGNVVDAAGQDAAGRAVLTTTAPPAGVHQLTAHTPADGIVAAATSSPAPMRTTAAIAGIPRIDIVTDDGDPITSEETYKRATLTIDPRGSGVPSFSASTRLRVRGNFTATVLEKLPYRLKLDTSTGLMGLPTSKDWVLLASYFDRTLLRTTLGMEVGRRMGLPWSPRMVDVEVRLNGELKGVYQLGESIKADGDRADIELADEDATDAGPGGFLLEVDDHDDSDPRFVTSRGLQGYVKEPEDATPEFTAGVGAQLEAFEDALYSPAFRDPATGYARLVDLHSFVDWYLTNELVKSVDAGMMNSVYLTRTLGGRLSMGPPWDFDIGAGNRVPWQGTSPTGWFVRHNWYGDPDGVPSQMTGPEGHWFVRLFQDPAFEAAVRARWVEVRAGLFALPAFLAARRSLIEEAALRNFTPAAEGGAGFVTTATAPDPEFAFKHWATWDESADALSDWLTARIAWMDQQLS